MSTTTHEARVKIIFEDADSRTYAIGIAEEDRSGVKNRVKEINNGTGTGAQYTAPMKSTFVSDTGSPMAKIGAVTIVSTTEEVIFSG